jgi:hypothetical protein
MFKVDCFGTELVVDILMEKNQMAILNLSPLEDYIWAKIFYEFGWNVPDPSNIAKSCFAFSMGKKEVMYSFWSTKRIALNMFTINYKAK